MGKAIARKASIGSNSATHRKRAWRKQRRRPGEPAYYCVINGRGHWQPNKRLRSLGFSNVSCGPDGPEARAIADNMNRLARAKRALSFAITTLENAAAWTVSDPAKKSPHLRKFEPFKVIEEDFEAEAAE